MAGHTFFGKQKLCYTEVLDFTDYQGIGHDPMYKRYDSVFSVISRAVPQEWQHFLATPEYLKDEDQICWHIDEWNEPPTKLKDLSEPDLSRYKSVLSQTVGIYKSALNGLSGEDLQIFAGAIKYIDDDRIYCADGKVYLVAWGMTPDAKQHKVIGEVIHEYDGIKKYKITFDAGEHGILSSPLDKVINRVEGTTLSQTDIPIIVVDEGWTFDGWSPAPEGHIVDSDIKFSAIYSKETKEEPVPPIIPPIIGDDRPEEILYNCSFDAGPFGTLHGNAEIAKPANSTLSNDEIPTVTPIKGKRFIGWDKSITNPIKEDKAFTALYVDSPEILPWYKRLWLWLASLFGLKSGRGCLKWLLWLLLGLLAIWLVSWLLRGCGLIGGLSGVNGVAPIDSITRSDGRVVEDNGFSAPVTGEDGVLPDDNSIVAPVLGEGGKDIPIIEQPGAPNTIANRFFVIRIFLLKLVCFPFPPHFSSLRFVCLCTQFFRCAGKARYVSNVSCRTSLGIIMRLYSATIAGLIVRDIAYSTTLLSAFLQSSIPIDGFSFWRRTSRSRASR